MGLFDVINAQKAIAQAHVAVVGGAPAAYAQAATTAALKQLQVTNAAEKTAGTAAYAAANNMTVAQAQQSLAAQDAAHQAAIAAGKSGGGLTGFLSAVAGPVQSALNNTPLAPFAGAISDVAKGDYKAAAADAAAAGVELAIQATPLGDVPILGQIAETEAGSFVKNMIQGQTPAQASTRAAAGATQAIAQAVVSGSIPGVSLPVAPSRPSAAGGAGAPPGVQAPDAIAKAVSETAAHIQDVVKPYGKTFLTRSAWESFAMRPETAGGTIGFPNRQ